jgi:CsoR family transcriptional regulator, copper-sensing transcriptional repressor
MSIEVDADAKKRLARIQGQVNGIAKMVDEGRYCVDILTQVSALRAALDQFGLVMLTKHIEECVYSGDSEAFESSEQRVEELRVTLNRFLK